MELFAIEIRTTQWQKLVEWYSAALGMKSSVRSDEDGYALLVGSGWRLAILARDEVDHRNHSTISLAIEVEDLGSAQDHIAPLLTETPAAIESSDEGFLQWTITDPDGNRIKLFQFVTPD
ncbi:VOC family protein [Bremerella cremea]|uniref:VOC family protein n=1 Tax=Bremerella cremea TaxID=1031537 RepID=UPI0031EED0F6